MSVAGCRWQVEICELLSSKQGLESKAPGPAYFDTAKVSTQQTEGFQDYVLFARPKPGNLLSPPKS